MNFAVSDSDNVVMNDVFGDILSRAHLEIETFTAVVAKSEMRTISNSKGRHYMWTDIPQAKKNLL